MNRLLFVLIIIPLLISACSGEQATPTRGPTKTPEVTATAVPTVLPTATKKPTPVPTTAPAGAPTPTPLPIQVARGIAYIERPLGLKLDIYAPTEKRSWPVVVVVHGIGGDELMSELSKAIAAQGAVVFTVDWNPSYAVSSTANDGVAFREWSETLTCAVRFARVMAPGFGGNPGQITVFGHSAGGYGGLWTAMAGDDGDRLWDEFASKRGGPPPQVDCLVNDTSAYPDAFVGYGGAYLWAEFLKGEEHELWDIVSPEAQAKLLWDMEAGGKDPELWEVVSPFALIGGNPGLQVRLIHGARDSWMASQGWMEYYVPFVEALIDAGYDATLTVTTGQHVFSIRRKTGQTIIQAIMEVSHD